MLLFLLELNNILAWATNIGNAYFEAYTTEKLFICAGPEFGDQTGHLLIINKALYGLCTSSQRFNELIGKCFLSLSFEQSKCESDIWIQDASNYYEYIATYMDNLAIIVKEPEKFFKQLQGAPFNFKLKGSTLIDGAIHLGCAFAHDQQGVLYMDLNQYIKQIEEAYKHRFNVKPDTCIQSPLDPGDHPKLDVSGFLDEDDTKIY